MQRIKSLLVGLLVGLGVLITPAGAQEAQVTILIEADLISEFGQLIDESEARLRQRITQTFLANPTIQQLQVQIVASRGGAIVPIMRANVSRSDWQKSDRIDAWTQYFSSTEFLLSYQSIAVASDVVPEPPITNGFPTTQEAIELLDGLD